jgi:3'5'-cyclic nucleotide phosphodiesterase
VSINLSGSIHAADVLQGAMILLAEHYDKLTKQELFNVIIACAIHDLDHPGVNNTFLVQSSHPLAILYNDTAVLEAHHVSKAFDIARRPDCNIFQGLSNEQYRSSRKSIISMVLATGK